jgi:hypothetical protein
MRVLLGLLFCCVAAVAALAQEHGEVRVYLKDWLAACRADGYCSATAYQNPNPGDGRVADYVLRIGRHARETYWEVSLTTIAAMADPSALLSAAVDGAAVVFEGPDEIAAYGSVNDFFLLGPGAQEVMDRLVLGQEVVFEFTDTDAASRRAAFSLSGLAAALIWIDEQQHRLGSERVAEVPPFGLQQVCSDVESIPPELVALHNESGCYITLGGDNLDEIVVGQLDPGHRAFIVPCDKAPYNQNYVVYVEGNGVIEAQQFEYPKENGDWRHGNSLDLGEFDAATGTITSLSRLSRLGNCGDSGIWRWSGFRFILLEYRSRTKCDGSEEEWPLVFAAPGVS